MNELALRTHLENKVLELLQWLDEYFLTEEDPSYSGTVHFLNSGAVLLGFYEYGNDYVRFLNLTPLPKGWFGRYETDTLWEVYLSDLSDRTANESLLKVGTDHAIDAFLGGPHLAEQRQKLLRRNIIRAVSMSETLTKRLPEHIQPYTEGNLELFNNGNVALTLEPSRAAGRELEREFLLNYRSKPVVFGALGDEFICEVNLGCTKNGSQITWAEVNNLINKATA
ncbi:MAG: hypothetical protein H6592_03480 [Flavobacteriales bacterium]|nr:hypothetical protein [Flavobacteriales bacterium]